MYFYIDTENVSNWVDLLNSFVRGINYTNQSICMNIHVVMFYTKNSVNKKFTIQELVILHKLGVDLIDEFCSCGSKNALDFQLSTYLGGDVSSKNDMFVIMSRDRGYDVVVEFWKKKGKNILRFPDSNTDAVPCIGENSETVLQYIKSGDKQKLKKYCISQLDTQISNKELLLAAVEGFVYILMKFVSKGKKHDLENAVKSYVISVVNKFTGSKNGKKIVNNQFWGFFDSIIIKYLSNKKRLTVIPMTAKIVTTKLPSALERLCTYFNASELFLDEETYIKFVQAVCNVLDRGSDKVYFKMAVYNELRHLLGNRLGIQVYSKVKTSITNEAINEMLGDKA